MTQFFFFSFYDLTNLDKSQSEPLTGFKDNYQSYIAIARLPADCCSQIKSKLIDEFSADQLYDYFNTEHQHEVNI